MLPPVFPRISDFLSDWRSSIFADSTEVPWEATSQAEKLISDRIAVLDSDFMVQGTIAVHKTAVVESTAVLKGPIIIGKEAFVAANSYLRGGVFIDSHCIVGPSCELKTTFMFAGSKVAHLSFVGDSIIGAQANIEAGAIIANYRNERTDRSIQIAWSGRVIETGVDKFGALIGDNTRVGANAVVAPGAVINNNSILPRLSLFDQSPTARPSP